jgi:hypothetical protein
LKNIEDIKLFECSVFRFINNDLFYPGASHEFVEVSLVEVKVLKVEDFPLVSLVGGVSEFWNDLALVLIISLRCN